MRGRYSFGEHALATVSPLAARKLLARPPIVRHSFLGRLAFPRDSARAPAGSHASSRRAWGTAAAGAAAILTYLKRGWKVGDGRLAVLLLQQLRRDIFLSRAQLNGPKARLVS